ncbi:hypothetical protein FRB90_009185, partial [Tulasnella sp. 427]
MVLIVICIRPDPNVTKLPIMPYTSSAQLHQRGPRAQEMGIAMTMQDDDQQSGQGQADHPVQPAATEAPTATWFDRMTPPESVVLVWNFVLRVITIFGQIAFLLNALRDYRAGP